MTKAEIPYWRVENPEHFSVRSFPVFKEANMMDKESIQQFFVGIPILEYPGLLKVRHCYSYNMLTVSTVGTDCELHW